LATVPHHHIYGLLFRVLWPLCAGRPFGSQTLADPVSLQAAVMKGSRSVLVSSPAHLERLPVLADLALWSAKLGRIFSSGGPLSAANAHAIREAVGRAPTEVLGSTETGGIAWRERDGSRDEDAWTPLPGVVLRVDEARALHVSSPYAGVTELATGDAASCLPDGRMQLLGRIDRIAKVEGKRVSLEEMETRLRQHPWVREARTAPLPDRDQRLGAVVVLGDLGKLALAERTRAVCAQTLRAHLAPYFDAVLLPRRWRFVDALPFDERGKITAAALAEILGGADDEHAS
jgi:acyl-coenzyme A synthetase/AMP-(fatty) acid ligase